MTSAVGLTSAEVVARHQRYGSNQLPEPKRPGVFTIIVDELRNPLLLVLAGAAVVAIVVGERVDGTFILIALAVSAAFGVAMAVRAERALRALRSMLAPTARVIRDGHEVEIPATELVPGDSMVLERGMRVSADAQVIEANGIEVDESTLTGESLPVAKQAVAWPTPVHSLSQQDGEHIVHLLWQGTTLVEGSGIAIVTATGTATRFATIAASLVEPRERTPLQEQLGRLSAMLTALILGLTIVILLIGIARGVPFGSMLTMSIAVAVAAIPEGIAIAVTASLAVGAVALARRRCLVRRLVAAETLGAVSVILTDKTGTLTEGRMRATGIRLSDALVMLDGRAIEPAARACLEAAAVATSVTIMNPDAPPHAWECLGSRTEAALAIAAGNAGIDVLGARRAVTILNRLPFSGERKHSVTLIERQGQRERLLLGAPERIVSTLPMGLAREIDRLGTEGFRLIGIARTLEFAPERTELLGIILLRDPVRSDVADALRCARGAGIRTVMVTGDHPATATRVARDIGLSDGAPLTMIGANLDALTDTELRERIERIDVFARTTHVQKLRIVRAWRSRGAVVAVTGDGVNDAPALLGADVGIAMGSGTDVAREASDLVLLNDQYPTIIAGIAGGRMIWDNLRKTTSYLLLSSASEVILIGGALLLGLPLPVLPSQILWVNLVEDVLPAAALAFEPIESRAMREPPRRRDEPLITRESCTLILGAGIIGDLALLAVVATLLAWTGDLALTRTIAFGSLGMNAICFVFGIRVIRDPLWRTRPAENPWLLGAVACSTVLLVLGLTAPTLRSILRTVPLPVWGWLIIVGIGISQLFAVEVVKTVFRRRSMGRS